MPPSTVPFALPAGTVITGYEIVRALGAGGFGITYEGYNRVTRRRVAIKEFFPRGMASRDGATEIVFTEHDKEIAQWALKRFEESTTALAELEHKNVLQVLNYVSDHGTGYMVMEHVDGSTFEDWLKAKPVLPALDQLRPVLEPILDALEYVHAKNMLHRDIAPDNIMIAKDGRPVLIDFGAIKVIEEQTRIKTAGSYAVGKRFYSPPEQLSGNAKLDARTDLYALAAVIYRALTGEPPVDADHRRGEVIDGGKDPYVPIAQTAAATLPASAQQAIDRALSLRRDERPLNIAEFRSALGWLTAKTAPGPEQRSAFVELPPEETRLEAPRTVPMEPATRKIERQEIKQEKIRPTGPDPRNSEYPAPEFPEGSASDDVSRKPRTARYALVATGVAAVLFVAFVLPNFMSFRSESVTPPPPQQTSVEKTPTAQPSPQVRQEQPAAIPESPSQKWVPVKPIRLIVPFAAGGPTDVIGRVVAEHMSRTLGQAVVVENVPGAGGSIGADRVARADADGYTIGVGSLGILATNEFVIGKLNYNVDRDFSLIALCCASPIVLVVDPSVSAKNVAEFVAAAKSQPGKFTFASAGAGTLSHLAAEQFNLRAGVSLTHIPYRGVTPALEDIISGRVTAMFADWGNVRSQVAAGRLRVLGTATNGVSDLNLNAPAISASVPGVDVSNWYGFYAPKHTPTHVARALAGAIEQALNDRDVRRRMEDLGVVVRSASSTQFAAFLAAERRKWQEVIQHAGIRAN